MAKYYHRRAKESKWEIVDAFPIKGDIYEERGWVNVYRPTLSQQWLVVWEDGEMTIVDENEFEIRFLWARDENNEGRSLGEYVG